MLVFHFRAFQKFVAVLLVVLCSACTYKQGMHMDINMDPNFEKEQLKADVKPVFKYISLALLEEEKKQREQAINKDPLLLFGEPKPYLLGRGDFLNIVVWDHPELNAATISHTTSNGLWNEMSASSVQEYVIDPNGYITYPHVGEVKAEGLSVDELRKIIAQKLSKTIKNPYVTINIQSYRSKRIYVSGEVKSQGVFFIDDVPMTFMEAINRAGGILPSGDQTHIVLLRDNKNYRINLVEMREQSINPAKIMLQAGDEIKVYSNEDNKIYILGEVYEPRRLTMRNSRMTLNEALGEAGGVNPMAAEARQVYVVRNATGMQPVIYNLNAKTPIAFALAENFELKPKDVIFVDTTALADWDRATNLFIPSAVTIITSRKASGI